jgi:hypothetical protein
MSELVRISFEHDGKPAQAVLTDCGDGRIQINVRTEDTDTVAMLQSALMEALVLLVEANRTIETMTNPPETQP